MISDRAKRVRERCASLRQSQKERNSLALLQTRAEDIEQYRLTALQAKEILTALAERGIDAQVEKAAQHASVFETLMDFVNGFAQKPELLFTADDTEYRKAHSITTNACQQVLASATSAWREYVNNRMPGDNRTLLRAFEGTEPELVKELLAKRQSIGELSQENRPSDEQIKSFDKAVTEYSERLMELLGDLPESVQETISLAASSRGAPLSAFTPEVLGSLRQHGIEDSFQVRLP